MRNSKFARNQFWDTCDICHSIPLKPVTCIDNIPAIYCHLFGLSFYIKGQMSTKLNRNSKYAHDLNLDT